MNNIEEILIELSNLKSENEGLRKIIKSLKQIISEDGEEIKKLKNIISLSKIHDKSEESEYILVSEEDH